MVLIGEVVNSFPSVNGWMTTLRIPFRGQKHLIFVDAPEEWVSGSQLRIEIEPIYDPPVGRRDEIGCYKAEKEAEEDVSIKFGGGEFVRKQVKEDAEDVINRFWKGEF